MSQIPSFKSLVMSPDAVKAAQKEVSNSYPKGLKAEEFTPLQHKKWREIRNNVIWDNFYWEDIFKTPAHPEAISSIDLASLRKFPELKKKDDASFKHSFVALTEDDLPRAIHCFLKLFFDPNMAEDYLGLLHDEMGIKLLGVAPRTHYGDGETNYSSFVIGATKSNFPERALLVHISNKGSVDFRCLNISGSKIEVSEQSSFSLFGPTTKRRVYKECTNYQAVISFVFTALITEEPIPTNAFKSYFPMIQTMTESFSNYKPFVFSTKRK